MNFTKKPLLKNETDIFYINQKISSLPANKLNKHFYPSIQQNKQKNKKTKKSMLRRKTLPENEKGETGS
ncbi:hypothetical protein ACTBAD_005241, partial [Escherichia coli]